MRIQNNIMAMNTHRFYTANNNAVSKSAEKLSSGYRVNRAGDDAAGLAISEKMRAEIRGLSMASKNAQDGVSMVQTAEGALTEVQSMLQRMKEIAVQAASDSNEDQIDRPALDQEFQALIKEIDDVAKTTTFNDMKLLDGSFQDKVIQIGSRTGNEMEISIGNMNAAALGLAAKVGDEVASLTGATATFTDGSTAGTTYSSTASGTASTNTAVATNALANFGTLTSSAIADAYETATGVANGTNAAVNMKYDDASGKFQLLVGTTVIGTADDASKDLIGATTPDSFDLNFKDASGNSLGKVTVTGSNSAGTDVTAATIKTDLGTEKATGITLTTTSTTTTDAQATIALDASAATMDKEGKASITIGTGDAAVKALSVSVEDTDGDGAISKAEIANAFVGKTFQYGGQTFTGALAANETEKVTFTAGNPGKIDADAATAAANVSVAADNGAKVDLLNQDNASAAIDICRDALNKVSTQRAELGAIQNRLEHKISNLDNTVENVSAAESRIRDVDIAKEMTNFTKNNILSQAATAMLAQANSLPQGVLSLLQ